MNNGGDGDTAEQKLTKCQVLGEVRTQKISDFCVRISHALNLISEALPLATNNCGGCSPGSKSL